MGNNTVNFWEKSDADQTENEGFDSFRDYDDYGEDIAKSTENFENDVDEDALKELEEANKAESKLDNLCTRFLNPKNNAVFDYKPGKIETNMYQYMIDNYEKIMYWISFLAKTPTCRKKFQVLAENTHMNEEDLIQETYARILKTFYDNEQRLKVCQNCKHQCNEFLNKTKKTNTEKFAEGRKCRPYMYYNLSEKEFHNYINHSLKQNIDIKLKKLTNKNGERLIVKTEEPIGSSDDACELGTLLSDTLGIDSNISRELMENLLSKKIIFTNKLANFTLLPDIFEQEDQYVEFANDKYDEKLEQQKAKKRSVYERYNLAVPENLKPTPKMVKYNIGTPVADLMQELDSRFNLIPTYWTQKRLWENLLLKAKNEGIDLSKPFNKKALLKYYGSKALPELDEVLPDEFIREVQVENGETPENVKEAEECAKMDMIACLPNKEDINEYLNSSVESYLEYRDYLQDCNDLENLQMEYNEKTTEIKIVDKDYKVVPLPLCTYAEVTVQDFLELCSDIKQGYEFFNSIFGNSEHVISFREFWIDFENKSYFISENVEYKERKAKRKSIYRLEKLARRMLSKNLTPISKQGLELFIGSNSIVDQFTRPFINKVCKLIKQEAIDMGYGKFVTKQKMMLPVKKKVTLSQEERIQRARAELNRILELHQKIRDNKINNINTATEDTLLPNLNPQELFSLILEKIPTQETKYVLEEVKVLCTSQSDNLKNVLSV